MGNCCARPAEGTACPIHSRDGREPFAHAHSHSNIWVSVSSKASGASRGFLVCKIISTARGFLANAVEYVECGGFRVPLVPLSEPQDRLPITIPHSLKAIR